MILQIQRGLAEDGFEVAISKLCRWFGVPRRTVYYRSVKAPAKVQERFAEPIKALIEASRRSAIGRSWHCGGSTRTRCSEFLS